jgi:antitoxin VapB
MQTSTPHTTAKVFQSGNSQAVRMPKEFRFKSKQVEIERRGNEIILREARPRSTAYGRSLVNMLRTMPSELADALDNLSDPPPEPAAPSAARSRR